MKTQTKQVKKTNKKHESGRSMIEMVGVLAVMGLITAAAFVLITSAMSSQRISRIDDDVSSIVQGVRLLYNPSDNFAGLSDSGALQVLGYKDAKNPYGGDYQLESLDTATTYNTDGSYAAGTLSGDARFAVKLTGLGENVCKTLVNRNWQAGGTTTGWTTGSTGDVGYTANNCQAGSSNTVTIVFGKSDKANNI